MIRNADRRQRRYRYAVPALMSVALLLLAACSSSSKNSAGGNPSGTSAPGSGSGSTTTPRGSDIKGMGIPPLPLAGAPAQAGYDAVRIQADPQKAKGGVHRPKS